MGNLLQQKRIGTFPGAVLTIYSGSTIYQGIFNTILLVITTYNTSLRETIHVYLPWMNFWLFCLFAFIGNMTVMILHWKYIQPSLVEFGNKQGYVHPNPTVDILRDLDKRIKKAFPDDSDKEIDENPLNRPQE